RRYPQLEDQLRPLLQASLMARNSRRLHVPVDVRRRGRSRLLQQAAEMSEGKTPARRRALIPIFPRLAITVGLVGALVLTSTGLVSAASGTLPGQQLYPVKRTWESVQLMFVFSPEQRDVLESDFEQERLNETSALLGRRLAAPISFSGLLSRQSDGKWLISGIPVMVSASTTLPAVPIVDGAPVTVTGTTRADGLVEAQQIWVLQPGSALPPLEPSEQTDGEGGGSIENSGGASGIIASATAQASPSHAPGLDGGRTTYQFRGVVEAMQGNVWRINGQAVYMDTAKINGNIKPGSIVKLEGYYGSDGRFMVTSVASDSNSVNKKQSGDGPNQPSGDSGGDKRGDGGGGDSGGGDP
ncbi:MAG: DUF5667 domain-containing protein, partial [Anaerolineales bacterium]